MQSDLVCGNGGCKHGDRELRRPSERMLIGNYAPYFGGCFGRHARSKWLCAGYFGCCYRKLIEYSKSVNVR